MSNVNLSIGGRSFTVACAAGEEDRVAGLGKMIDQKLQAMGGATGQSEARMLLFAALMLADELHESQHGEGAPVAPAPPPVDDSKLAQQLEAIATRLENCAAHLEGTSPSA
jgi:cell division protein ZapA